MKKNKIPKVYLIGAGPGDPGLITIKGFEALKCADVILYDHLANPDLLGANPDAEKIYVGKKAGKHYTEQDEIIELILKKASEGKTIARLKGGDPLVFARGSEEALALAKAGHYFEIIPGVTAANGASAYMGIPLTHRNLVTETVLVTAHECPEKEEAQTEWQHLAKLQNATIVIYMGAKNIKHIVDKLISYGMAADMPAAIIENGTMPHQRCSTGILIDIPAIIEREGFKPPLITILGHTVPLRDIMYQIKNKSLLGKRIIVTRAKDQAGEIYKSLSEKGAVPIPFPVIKTSISESINNLDEVLSHRYDWLVFTSSNGVRYFFEALNKKGKDIRAAHDAKIAAVGLGTAETLKQYGIIADFIPEKSNAVELVNELARNVRIEGMNFLRIKGDFQADPLTNNLENKGAKVTCIETYRLMPDSPEEHHVDELLEKGADAALFTSVSTLENFFLAIGEERAKNILGKLKIIAIGPVTSAGMMERGITNFIQSPKTSMESMIETLEKSLNS